MRDEAQGAGLFPARADSHRYGAHANPWIGLAILALLLAQAVPRAHAADLHRGAPWQQSPAPTLHVDNDFFAPSNGDRDYTGGVAISLPQVNRPHRWSLDRLLAGLVAGSSGQPTLRSVQFQALAFTPGTLAETNVIESDRPYASLVALTAARQRIDDARGRAMFASLTIGAVGLSAVGSAHRAVHRVTGTPLPEGYDHQVSAGGEPTAKITIARRQLLNGGGLGRGTDLWVTTGGSLGYLTEGTVAIAMRWGERGTPWWASGVELADYAPAPDLGIVSLGPETSLDIGLKLRLRAYNAFVQGQFRHSDHRVGFADTVPVVVEAWIGGTMAVSRAWRVAMHLVAQTGELREGQASGVHLRGSVAMTYSF